MAFTDICSITLSKDCFDWDTDKDLAYLEKHGVSFQQAQYAFPDPGRFITADLSHCENEKRYYGFGKTVDGILTVRFTPRKGIIRIMSAGYWFKGKQVYEQENRIHQ